MSENWENWGLPGFAGNRSGLFPPLNAKPGSVPGFIYRSVVSQFMMPLYFGEVPIIFWLLIIGAKVKPLPATAS